MLINSSYLNDSGIGWLPFVFLLPLVVFPVVSAFLIKYDRVVGAIISLFAAFASLILVVVFGAVGMTTELNNFTSQIEDLGFSQIDFNANTDQMTAVYDGEWGRYAFIFIGGDTYRVVPVQP